MSKEQAKHTPGEWELGHHKKGKLTGTPNTWTIKQHEFPNYPYEGELEDEWGIYPPLGESGPVALVAGEANARLVAASPDLLESCQHLLAFLLDDNPGGFAADSHMAELADKAKRAIAKAKGESA